LEVYLKIEKCKASIHAAFSDLFGAAAAFFLAAKSGATKIFLLGKQWSILMIKTGKLISNSNKGQILSSSW